MSKRVRITLEVDEQYVRLLQAKCQLKGWLNDDSPELDAGGILCVIVLGEARGATELQILERTPSTWRSIIAAIHEERRVIVNPHE
jgi:hypothetical protein